MAIYKQKAGLIKFIIKSMGENFWFKTELEIALILFSKIRRYCLLVDTHSMEAIEIGDLNNGMEILIYPNIPWYNNDTEFGGIIQ